MHTKDYKSYLNFHQCPLILQHNLLTLNHSLDINVTVLLIWYKHKTNRREKHDHSVQTILQTRNENQALPSIAQDSVFQSMKKTAPGKFKIYVNTSVYKSWGTSDLVGQWCAAASLKKRDPLFWQKKVPIIKDFSWKKRSIFCNFWVYVTSKNFW